MAVAEKKNVWEILDDVQDPEIPVLSVIDLGIIREIDFADDGHLKVTITPTYSGCPAMNMIEVNIKSTLQDEGFDNVEVITQYQPAWTTDWMTEEGKKKLKEYGIAPPEGSSSDKSILMGGKKEIECPHCGSKDTEMTSAFGATPCKALYRCTECEEPFEYFKCH